MSGQVRGLGNQNAQTQVLSLPLISGVSLGKFPRFAHLSNGAIKPSSSHGHRGQ